MNKKNEKKRKNKLLLYFAFFSRSVFQPKPSRIPLFPQDGWADRAQIFFITTLVQLGCIYFYQEISVVPDLEAFRKFTSSKEQGF
jgi:hypothetical protein